MEASCGYCRAYAAWLLNEFYECIQGTAVDDPEKNLVRKPDDKEPLAGLAFKIMADQFQVCHDAKVKHDFTVFVPSNDNRLLAGLACNVMANHLMGCFPTITSVLAMLCRASPLWLVMRGKLNCSGEQSAFKTML